VGYFVAGTGQAVATPAALGRYVAFTAAATDTAAALGYYVPVTAASSQTPAALGHYVALAGASTQSAAAIGHYVPVTGASSQTPAAAGYYVATAGASTQTAAPLGRYVSTTGQTAALMATAGYYVPVTGASSQTPAAEGYYVATEGASLQTPARYSYFAGATASTAEPLVNDGAAGALLAPLAVAGREIRLLQSLNSQRGIDNNGSATVHVPAGQTLQLGGTFTESRITNVVPQDIGVVLTDQFMPVSFGVRVIRIVLRNRSVQSRPTLDAKSLEGPVNAAGVIHTKSQTSITSCIGTLLNKIAL
jgi:hypothetical protein